MTLAAVQAACQRHQTITEALHPGSITLAGKNYTAAISLGTIQQVPQEDGSGWDKLQTLTVQVRKALLPTAPGKRTVITHNGVDYLVTTIGGQSAQEPAWRIQAERRSPAAS
jgi:hypothetical protein